MPEIVLNLRDSYKILLLLFILCFFVLFYGTKFELSKKNYLLSKDNSKQLQGLFILVVVIHHIAQRVDLDFLRLFLHMGYAAVGVFFILSGYGLIKSLHFKEYFSNFIPRKIITILLPFFIINFITSVVLFYADLDSGPLSVTDFLSLSLVDSTLWFIITIFVFYVFFYVSFSHTPRLRPWIHI